MIKILLMRKSYFYLLIGVFLFLSAPDGFAQNNASINQDEQSIKGLSVFPNPVNSGKSTIFITSSSNIVKKVAIYNVLGKQISRIIATRKTLDISALSSGVYILKITEGNVSETRKLVIK